MRSSLARQVLDHCVMDIVRPGIREKRKRRRIVFAGAVVILIAAALLVWRLELKHHRTYVTLERDHRKIQALVVYPEGRNKAPVVILVHEIYGLTDWAKNMADELADAGFIVIAPDLLSGYGPKGGRYDDFPSEGERETAVSDLDPAGVMADLDAVADFGKKLPGDNGKIAVVGFSWGGWKSFAFATHRKDLSAAFVFYGTGPDDVTTINAPVYGFYGGEDGGVDSSVPATAEAMKAAGELYDPVTYEGADHGFMRLGDEFGTRSSANKAARNQAFTRLVRLLRETDGDKVTAR